MTAPVVSAWIGIGSNLDTPEEHVRRAADALDAIESTHLVTCSRLYRSPPWGAVGQPDFVNAVAHLTTARTARLLLEALLRIERAHGRRRDVGRWGPRTLDLDLLVYGDQIIDESDLRVPHPHIGERAFVLLPLVEIAPALLIPGIGKAADALARIDASSCVAIDAC